jgi:HemY protein
VRLGDSARQRLVRAETLAAKTPGHIEGALAIARAAIEASEFTKAREALAPFIADPTQRVALLMAEIERSEHGDSGKARTWTLRAVRARHDPAWTADGYVSERWRPVSPVTGRLDAFQWQTPVASLPSGQGRTIESSPFEEAMLAAPSPPRERPQPASLGEAPIAPASNAPAGEKSIEEQAVQALQDKDAQEIVEGKTIEDKTVQDNLPPAAKPEEKTAEAVTAPVAPAQAAAVPRAESVANPAPPLFRARADLSKPAASVPPVIPLVRPPDDPGVEDESRMDEFAEQIGAPKAQAGGWRGFWSRLGG